MKLYNIQNIAIPVVKCKQPKFSDHGGRCWESGKNQIDGWDVDFWLDVVYREFLYFVWNQQWYKVRMIPKDMIIKEGNIVTWNLDPFMGFKVTTKPKKSCMHS